MSQTKTIREANRHPLIRLRGTTRTFDGAPPVKVLNGISLDIMHGDYLAIVGRSGSGKSTLLHIVGLLDIATSGTYELEGEDVSALSDKGRAATRGARIGFVFQAFHLLPHRTALENVQLAQIHGGAPRSERRGRAIESLERVGLKHRVHAFPDTLSGGERQRVAIARAVVGQPDLLLADEPTGNLDTESSDAVLSLFGELNHDGLTLVVITHNAAVSALADRVLTMRAGLLTEPPSRRNVD